VEQHWHPQQRVEHMVWDGHERRVEGGLQRHRFGVLIDLQKAARCGVAG
jgi:hypothetical protein